MRIESFGMGMMCRFAAMTCVVVIAAGCGVPQTNFSTVAIDPVLTSSRSVVLAPLVIPPDLNIGEDALFECDSLVEAELLAAGFHVIPAQEYTNAWERIVDVMGGLYDTTTGEWDEEKYEVARDQLIRDLSDSYDFRMVVRPEIWLVSAPFSGGTATWDGVSQGMVGFGTRIMDLLNQLFNSEESSLPEGSVPAASLGIVFEGLDGSELYTGVGGIEVLEKVGSGAGAVTIVPDEELLQHTERISNAIRIALRPFFERDGVAREPDSRQSSGNRG